MKSSKIGVIMKKEMLRSNITIELQKRGYRVYIVPETDEMYDIIEKMDLELLLLGESDSNTFSGYVEEIKKKKSLNDIPVIAILNKNMQQSDMVNILKSGATDIIYLKNNNVAPVVATVDRFLNESKSEFNIKVQKVYNTNIVTVTGELDITNSFFLKKEFEALIRAGEKNFVFDISTVEYLESVALGTLIYIQKSIVRDGGKANFIIKSKKILKLLELVKMNKYFEIYENIEEVITLPKESGKTRVVVIDDAKFMRALIKGTLEGENFEVFTFTNPVEAMPELDKLSPDIILVDYEMPEMDGLQFIEKFKPHVREIPTIMLTTVQDINLALKAIRLGASDFLNKPFEKEELIHIIRKIVKENSLKKENERLLLELKKRERELERKNMELNSINRNIEEELEMASEIQKKLLPQGVPTIPGFEFAVKFLPSQDIGGDFYDFINMSNGRVGVAFADISGHGIPAALLSSMFKVFLNTYAPDIIYPSEAMELINDIVCDNFTEGKFVSTFYMVIDANTKKIKYCKASQEPGLYLKNDGTIEELSTRGQVLGLFSTIDFPDMVQFEESELQMEVGEKIFLYTDGIVEAKNKKEEFYGMERLFKVLKENKHLSINEILERAYGDLLDFMEGIPISDDLTLLGIERVKE